MYGVSAVGRVCMTKDYSVLGLQKPAAARRRHVLTEEKNRGAEKSCQEQATTNGHRCSLRCKCERRARSPLRGSPQKKKKRAKLRRLKIKVQNM